MTSSSLLNGDVSEMAASGINCATGGASGQRLDASQRVKIVIAEITIGAQRDGRQIGVHCRFLSRDLMNRWTLMVMVSAIVVVTRRSAMWRTVIGASGASTIE
jgi:hypothetical protein